MYQIFPASDKRYDFIKQSNRESNRVIERMTARGREKSPTLFQFLPYLSPESIPSKNHLRKNLHLWFYLYGTWHTIATFLSKIFFPWQL